MWPRGNTPPETALPSGYGVDPSDGLITFAAPGAAEVAAP